MFCPTNYHSTATRQLYCGLHNTIGIKCTHRHIKIPFVGELERKRNPLWDHNVVKLGWSAPAEWTLKYVYWFLYVFFSIRAGRQCKDEHYTGLRWRPCSDLLQCQRHWGRHQAHLQRCGDLPRGCDWGELLWIRNCNTVPACDKWAPLDVEITITPILLNSPKIPPDSFQR